MSPARGKPKKGTPKAPKSRDEIIREMRGRGDGWQQIAEATGMTRDAVARRYAKIQRFSGPEGAVPVAEVDPTHDEIMRLERDLEIARGEARTVGAKLRKSRLQEGLFAEAAAVIREHQAPLPPVRLVPTISGSGGEMDMVLILADEHADAVVTAAGTWGMERYDFNVFRCRLERLLRKTIDYATKHLPQHKFHRLWVLKLGDAVHGDIHGHGPHNHFGNTIKAALAVGDTEAQFVQALIPHFPGGVHVVAVSGNHPRRSARKDYDNGPQDNFDFLVATQIATRLQGEIDLGRVTVHCPDSWMAFAEIRGRVWALNHGDDVKGFAGLPWYGFERKNNRVQALVARFDQRVSYFCYGHYHTAVSFVSGGGRSLHSGAWPMTDPFALNAITAGNEPEQTLYVVDDPYGIVLAIPIYTRDPETEARCLAGDYEPALGTRLVIEEVDRASPDVGTFALHRVG